MPALVATSGAANSATSCTTTCRRPPLDDLEQVLQARLQLDPDEELGEHERANLRRRERRSHLSNAPRRRLHGVHGRPHAERRKSFAAGFAHNGFARSECHIVPCPGQGARQRQHRSIVTCQRSAAQQDAHRVRLPRPFRSRGAPSRRTQATFPNAGAGNIAHLSRRSCTISPASMRETATCRSGSGSRPCTSSP